MLARVAWRLHSNHWCHHLFCECFWWFMYIGSFNKYLHYASKVLLAFLCYVTVGLFEFHPLTVWHGCLKCNTSLCVPWAFDSIVDYLQVNGQSKTIERQSEGVFAFVVCTNTRAQSWFDSECSVFWKDALVKHFPHFAPFQIHGHFWMWTATLNPER